MAYKEISEINGSEGLHTLFTYAAEVEPSFIPLTLFVFFIIIAVATFFSTKRTTTKGDFAASFAVAGFATSVLAIAMTLIEGLISITTVVTVIVITVIGVLWLLVSKKE